MSMHLMELACRRGYCGGIAAKSLEDVIVGSQ